jgi:hypothetical protein
LKIEARARLSPLAHGSAQADLRRGSDRSFRRLLHDPNLLLGQTVELINKLVDLAVGGVDLALEGGFVVIEKRVNVHATIDAITRIH